jgi:hypothetical protein
MHIGYLVLYGGASRVSFPYQGACGPTDRHDNVTALKEKGKLSEFRTAAHFGHVLRKTKQKISSNRLEN